MTTMIDYVDFDDCVECSPPPSSVEVKERVGLYLYSTSGPSWPVLGLPLPLPYVVVVKSLVNVAAYAIEFLNTNRCVIFYHFNNP